MEQASHSVSISRGDPAKDKLALALAAGAWAEEERASRWQAVGEMLRSGRADDLVLMAAHRGEQLIAAVAAEVQPGKTAATWPAQFADGEAARADVAASLYAYLNTNLAARDIGLVQALLPGEDPPDTPAAAVLKAGGFAHAADLLYLASAAETFPDHPPELPFTTDAFDPRDAARLVRLIDRTYEGTLDCPQIDGLRETVYVIAGYQAVGQFRPELWRLAQHQGEDVGCLLVNLHPEVHHAEIVYLGLAPQARGRAWGLVLTRYAQWLAATEKCERVVLAVDAANEPAIRMYAAAGFSQWDRKALWIKSLRPRLN